MNQARPTLSFRFTAAAVSVLLLVAPALWNGFPLLQYDTGGYLARWFEGHLEESRSTVYGLFLALTARPDFWPAVVLPALLTVWVLWLTLRMFALARPPILVIVTALLAVTTSLALIASTLLTDVFAGIGVLALWLVTLRGDALVRWERRALFAVVAFAAATHSATLAVLVLLLAAGAAVAVIRPRLLGGRRLAPGALALLASILLLLAGNYAVAGRIAWTPGGSAIPFGRMLQTGIVARYLADHCPDPRLPKLCAHRADIPQDADLFFWGSDLFDQLGRFEGLDAEMRIVVRESLTAYPLRQIEAAILGTAQQLVEVASGYGIRTDIWHTYWIIETFAPQAAPAMQAARQQHGDLSFDLINRLHVPVAWGSMLLLVLVPALAIRRRSLAPIVPLALTIALALLANAAVCGALSNPHDRYGARMVWLATLLVTLIPAHLRAGIGGSQSGPTAGRPGT